jgi:hypothetical protein
LIVVIDADQYTVDERTKYLESQSNPKRDDGDRIAIFVPKRNIESWIVFLCRETQPDEEQSFKNRLRDGETPSKAVKKLISIYRQNEHDCLPDSMRRAVREYSRLRIR